MPVIGRVAAALPVSGHRVIGHRAIGLVAIVPRVVVPRVVVPRVVGQVAIAPGGRPRTESAPMATGRARMAAASSALAMTGPVTPGRALRRFPRT